ncbi:MAG: DUF1015 domain-containing protein [Planctomycetota bacterium]|jgi:uncharacterized protein (DUF1015 family)|nr:DUF1015 domain-containing protein [Planctomycetota bacterium]
MSSIFPFPGWRYDPGKADPARVTAPPYDVIDPEGQARLYGRDDRNVVRLILGREFPDDSPRNNRYTRAAGHLDAWRGDGLFIQDRQAVYPYEQSFSAGGRELVRRGFFARVRLSEWGAEGVYPHEKTMAGPKRDRLELMRATRGNLEPVFGLLADPGGTVASTLAGLADYSPCLEVRDDEGVDNRMWVVDGRERLHRLLSLAPEPRILIADGHHRYETALAYQAEIRDGFRAAGQTPPPRGELDCDYILMLLVPDSDPGLVVRPTHRLVHGLAGWDLPGFLAACERNFLVSPVSREELAAGLAGEGEPVFGLAADGRLFLLSLRSREAMAALFPGEPEAWRALDVSVLHALLLGDLLGIDEDKLLRRENIVYLKDGEEAVRAAEEGRDGTQCAFILRPTPMRRVREVAEAGAVMPQKSTYFYPKPLSGAVFHLFW